MKGAPHMNYKKYIKPELRSKAKKMPYNRAVIWLAGIFLPVILKLTPVPREIASRSISIAGHSGLSFRTEIFEPQNAKGLLPCLVYVHGGAFSYRASAYHKRLACIYALKANCRVFFPDYHLTPQYPYPAAYDDVLALYRYLSEYAEELGIDGDKIGLAGDSAGGCLAALICANYQRETIKRPCLQMLVYPLTDMTMQSDSMKRFSDTPLWNPKSSKRALSYYCKDLKAEEILRASPLHSRLPQIIPEAYI